MEALLCLLLLAASMRLIIQKKSLPTTAAGFLRGKRSLVFLQVHAHIFAYASFAFLVDGFRRGEAKLSSWLLLCPRGSPSLNFATTYCAVVASVYVALNGSEKARLLPNYFVLL